VRVRQRAAYQPIHVDHPPDVRGKVSLDGDWLFMPEQDFPKSVKPEDIDLPDQNWHVLPVPSFWTPTLGWLYGESGMPGLKGLVATHSPSDKLSVEEDQRVNAQTFDWNKTKAGWYREYVDLLSNLAGKEFHLVFDAIAKVSEIYV
jgi:hypothetical protein